MKARWLIGLLLTTGCGSPLVTSQFAGTPIFTVGGAVNSSSARVPANHGPLELSVFWIGAIDVEEARFEQEARLDAGLGEFSMTLFDPPPGAAGGFSDLVTDGNLAIGVIVLYADKDGSGDLTPAQDLLLGASAQHVVVYADSEVPSQDLAAGLVGAMGAGYHLFDVDEPSTCRFVAAADCPGEGALSPTQDLGAVSLTLWADPEEVRVPAPRLDTADRDGSIWTPVY